MNVQRIGSRPSGEGPDEWFTGTVRVDALFEAHEPSRVGGSSVTFEPGARTAWHSHPLGQTLIVTAGCGGVQRWGSSKIQPGRVFDRALSLREVLEGYRAMDAREAIKVLIEF